MSSATSIDRDVPVGERAERPGDVSSRDTFQPWHFFLLLSLAAATVAVLMARDARPEHLVLISLTVGAAGFAAHALYRTLVPLVSDPPQAVGVPPSERRRAGLEREKALVLRSIKELEFDRAMGKVSAKDFEEMAGRLRARALSLMRQLDAGSAYRELIERDLAARLRQQLPASAAVARAPEPAVSPGACACGTVNDADAAFCKRCGTRLEPAQS